MERRVQEIVEKLVGKPCCRKQVGRNRSLSLGFGDRIQHKTVLTDGFYGEWEVGTYSCAWRIVKEGKVLCGSQDAVDSIDDLNIAVDRIELSRFSSLRQFTDLDVRVDFDNGIAVDFLATISDEDECFHVFCPEKLVIVFSAADGWRIGPSDKPWN